MEHTLETLVILTPGFPANEADTACIPPQQLFVKALKEICPGLEIIVLTFHYPHVSTEYEWNGVKVITIGGKDEGQLSRLKTWTKAWFILRKLKNKYHPFGLLSFWMGECAFIGHYFAKTHGLKHYSWILGQDAKKGNKYFDWIKPNADSLIALSDFVANEVRKNYGLLPANIVPVGIDTSMFKDSHAKRDIDVLGAGSLIPLKQYHLFIQTIASLKIYMPEIKAVICGNGPEMELLKSLANSLRLNNNISFTGELPQKEVLALMQRSKVFLHTSNYEGFGSVMAEALYAGAHVVSFCKPMNKNYRHHYVVKNRDEMNQEVLSILKNTRRGHDHVLMFPIQQVAKNIISLFADEIDHSDNETS
ncbi:glycosyltransferase family 4 protein [Mucilaginibacter sp. X4EP1]|jgi:glycosyltransferase involved in cell wall biosynthesis|uniref:glycosyltransferase family 4 protein n=1 Tax=Mucilaginibacter sp. X4EP1 TaxID=2723092 RepID=UPI0021677E89|nr:glycosyltransferase family 4 protein [Mucilaginibacter sp. X4EP1]MCS3814091.1 glycosyltransferase involved in cell wall biosynthesis [Mucilaginibacter sp. X4EP1]